MNKPPVSEQPKEKKQALSRESKQPSAETPQVSESNQDDQSAVVEPVPELKPPSFVVVGVGASAGGREAFMELLKPIPNRPGMAFVLIPHLDPKHESAMTELLARGTGMPVRQVHDGMKVKPDCVYVRHARRCRHQERRWNHLRAGSPLCQVHRHAEQRNCVRSY